MPNSKQSLQLAPHTPKSAHQSLIPQHTTAVAHNGHWFLFSVATQDLFYRSLIQKSTPYNLNISDSYSKGGFVRVGGSQKGGFQKGGFGGCSPGTNKTEQGYIQMFPGTKNGTRVHLDVPWDHTGTRAHSPKPPFYETALLFPLDRGLDKYPQEIATSCQVNTSQRVLSVGYAHPASRGSNSGGFGVELSGRHCFF